MTIRKGVPADAPMLAALARDTFFETFASTNDAADMALHLERTYSLEQQAAELADPDIATLIAEVGERAVAYAQIRQGQPPACVTGSRAVEIWRFYVIAELHGRGVAQSLMERVRSEARARGAGTLWLGVWERNPKAQTFYRKCGFVDVGEHVFLVGTDPQTDRVMEAIL